MTLKAVLFDLDGVLIDSMPAHIAAWRKALSQENIPATKEDIALLEGARAKDIIDRMSEKYAVPIPSYRYRRVHKQKQLCMQSTYPLYEHVQEIISFLKQQGIVLALVTGSENSFVQEVLPQPLKKQFSSIITADKVQNGKPSPDPYVEALKELAISPTQALVIENAPLGISSAKNASVKTYALTTTLDKTHLQEADAVFDSHTQLFSHLKTVF